MAKSETNLAKDIPEETRRDIGLKIKRDYDNDSLTRSVWENRRVNFYMLWMGKRNPKFEPWPGASNVCLPMLATSCNQFHSRAYTAFTSPKKSLYAIPVEKNDVLHARRVEAYMNWQLQYDIENYEDETDRMLLGVPINGGAFKKIFPDLERESLIAEQIPFMDVVLPYRTRTLESARRITHRVRRHYDELERKADRYIDLDKISQTASDSELYDPPIEKTKDEIEGTPVEQNQKPKLLLETHCDWKLSGEKWKPYVMTVDYDSGTLLRVTSRLAHVGGKDHVLNHFVDYHFIPNPEGFYSFGFGHFLEHLNEMANTTFNQIFDAGRLSNQPFGFYGRRAGIKRKTISLHPGLMTEVEDAGQILFPNMQRLDQSLFQVLGIIQQYVEQYTSTSDYLLGREARGTKTPTATGTLAIIEQGLVLYSTMIKRLFRSQKKEFRLMYALNQISLPPTKQYFVLGTTKPDEIAFPEIRRKDFDGRMHVIPVGDPTYASRTQRRQEAQELLGATLSNPLVVNTGKIQIIDPKAVFAAYKNLYETYDQAHTMNLLPPEPKDPPILPETENAMFMQGDSIDPKPGEDHQAHLEAHERFRRSPLFAELDDDFKKIVNEHISKTKGLFQQELAIKAAMAPAPGQNGGPAPIPTAGPAGMPVGAESGNGATPPAGMP